MNQESNQLTPQRIIQFAWSYAVLLAMEAAVKNRVFDALDANGAMSLSQLSEQTDASERGLRALLDMLVSIELLEKRGGAMYALTPESAAFLVSTKPSFQGGIFKHISSQLIPKWMKLSEIVRSGKPEIAVNAEGEGSAFFEQFVEDIFPVSYPAAQTLSEHLKIAVIDAPMKVLDIGSGSGVWGVALAQESRNVRVTAVDWARVIAVTRRIALRHGVADRFTFVEGDILSANFGDGHNIATLGHILHSEGETRGRKLIKRVCDALAPGGTIVIAEFLANDDHTGPPTVMIFAVNMLVNTEAGDAFTFGEIASWLRDTGFTDPRALDAPGPSPLILAAKPN